MRRPDQQMFDETDQVRLYQCNNIWGYQHYFHTSIEIDVRQCLQAIKVQAESDVQIVGLRRQEGELQVLLESPAAEKPLEPYADLLREANNHLRSHPRIDLIQTDATQQARDDNALRDEALGEGLATCLERASDNPMYVYRSSMSATVEGVDVYILIGLPAAIYEQVPRLTTEWQDLTPIHTSLLESLIRDLLRRFKRALYIPNLALDVVDVSTREIVRSAAENFLGSIFALAGELMPAGSEEVFTAISSLPYEGREGSGGVLIAKDGHESISTEVDLRTPISLRDGRSIRKLIEAAGPKFDLVTDGRTAYGFVVILDTYDPAEESIFRLDFERRGHWSCSHAGETLFVVQEGQASLPEQPIDWSYFQDVLERKLDDSANFVLLKEIVAAARQAKHGAMVVISAQATNEAARLSPQALLLNPRQPSSSLVERLTSVDGALILDPEGLLHAFGVILDGVAAGEGNPARGSRFNNALRYVSDPNKSAVVVAFSEDGMIDIFPRLNPRVHRESIVKIVDDLVDASEEYTAGRAEGPGPRGRVARSIDELRAHRFYLNQRQCDTVNEEVAKIYDYDLQQGHFAEVVIPFAPDPKLDETYFYDSNSIELES